MKILKTLLRILIGVFFILTAIFKLISLDNFEIYIYSFQFFNFAFSAIMARMVIAIEMLLGSFLIFKILYKKTWWATLSMLLVFTVLLVYIALFRKDTNCHCLGDIVAINPVGSIVKNVVTIGLLWLIKQENERGFKGKKVLSIGMLTTSFLVPFACFPSDVVYNLFQRQAYKVDEAMITDFMQDSLAQANHLEQGNYVMAYVSAGCEYCKIGTKKLCTMVENNELDRSHVVFFIWGDKQDIHNFKTETQSSQFRYIKIDPMQAIRLVYGQFPTFVMIEGGMFVKATDLRGLNEKEIIRFLKNSDD